MRWASRRTRSCCGTFGVSSTRTTAARCGLGVRFDTRRRRRGSVDPASTPSPRSARVEGPSRRRRRHTQVTIAEFQNATYLLVLAGWDDYDDKQLKALVNRLNLAVETRHERKTFFQTQQGPLQEERFNWYKIFVMLDCKQHLLLAVNFCAPLCYVEWKYLDLPRNFFEICSALGGKIAVIQRQR